MLDLRGSQFVTTNVIVNLITNAIVNLTTTIGPITSRSRLVLFPLGPATQRHH